MLQKVNLFLVLFLLGTTALLGQQKQNNQLIILDTISKASIKINPLAPARAGFYSAILPGLGQAYNKNYWKIPIVYGAIGTSMYFYLEQNKLYNQFRNEYKSRLGGNGRVNLTQFSDNTLITGQRLYRRNRDLSLLISVGLYALNIVEANVDAHLKQFNVNDKLTFSPNIYTNPTNFKQNISLCVNYNF